MHVLLSDVMKSSEVGRNMVLLGILHEYQDVV